MSRNLRIVITIVGAVAIAVLPASAQGIMIGPGDTGAVTGATTTDDTPKHFEVIELNNIGAGSIAALMGGQSFYLNADLLGMANNGIGRTYGGIAGGNRYGNGGGYGGYGSPYGGGAYGANGGYMWLR